jgi:hypothetical protein
MSGHHGTLRRLFVDGTTYKRADVAARDLVCCVKVMCRSTGGVGNTRKLFGFLDTT